MSRIEEIKGHIKEGNELYELTIREQDWLDDMQYLLSKLETATKALDEVLTEHGYNHIEPSDRLKEIEYIVQDALKQIKEPG